MFKKACRVKSNTQLKASDRKKLKFELTSQFPNLTEDDLNTLLPSKTPVFSLKIVTNSGETVIIYTAQKLPLVFEIDKVMYPSVYMLWELPNLVSTLSTNEYVAQKITEGADLMLPGVIADGTNLIYGKLQRGERCAVNSTNNRAAFAVGIAVMGSAEMHSSGNKGKCVRILHTYGDKLWSLERTINKPQIDPTLKRIDESLKIVEDVAGYTENVRIVEEKDKCMTNTEANIEQLVIPEVNEYCSKSHENISKPNSMDELLMFSFLKSLVTSVKSVPLPLLANVFYKVHILEACPPGTVLDLKDTRYKKLSNFLNEMAENKLIVLESVTKGVLSISSIDYSHRILKEFLWKHPDIKSIQHDQKNQNSSPEISEKYTVTNAVLPLFSKFTYKKGDGVTAQDIRKQCFRVTDQISSTLEKKEYCGGVLLAVAQAFDRVWQPGLLFKLKRILPSTYYLILQSYLTDRYSVVCHRDKISG
ncbi:hypothetical protein AAG570_013142 [Ranatra chinensis]|uniref:Ligatin n=1 Tax=Ranatra chinensis TaxID=642074 RepID=A0ABD0YHU7_9HEMI